MTPPKEEQDYRSNEKGSDFYQYSTSARNLDQLGDYGSFPGANQMENRYKHADTAKKGSHHFEDSELNLHQLLLTNTNKNLNADLEESVLSSHESSRSSLIANLHPNDDHPNAHLQVP